jgi:EAL domain-containing protein (putative c-di-GMP-specific phosphodiesterase class I)
MNDSDPKMVRSWSGPISNLAEDDRPPLIDSMRPTPLPRIAPADALRNRWLEVWYQPKIDLKRKRLAGAEALVRIRHPQHGILLPRSLHDAADDGFAELARHVLLATLVDWSIFDEAGFNLHLALNVPVSALFKVPIPRLIAQYRPDATRWPGLILEVTEDQIARDAALAYEIATQLRVSGLSIAIDEFGAGCSSLSSLRDLPFAELKIDHSFVTGCATDAANAAICQTAIDLAHRFGGVAVASGVENVTDLQALVAMGCDFGQGALVAPPMPKALFLELLRQRMGKPRGGPRGAPDKAAQSAVDRVA